MKATAPKVQSPSRWRGLVLRRGPQYSNCAVNLCVLYHHTLEVSNRVFTRAHSIARRSRPVRTKPPRGRTESSVNVAASHARHLPQARRLRVPTALDRPLTPGKRQARVPYRAAWGESQAVRQGAGRARNTLHLPYSLMALRTRCRPLGAGRRSGSGAFPDISTASWH